MTRNLGVNVLKLVAYAVLEKIPGALLTRVSAYAVLGTPPTGVPPAWTSFTLANGAMGIAYSQDWDLSPATANTTYTVVLGALPTGLAVSNVSGDVGRLSGTPTVAGSYSFTIRASNYYGTADKAFSMTVVDATALNPPVWPTFTFGNGTVGVAYSQSWDLAPAAHPTTYSVVSGSLPTGLALTNVANDVGRIDGTPSAAATFNFTLRASNANGVADQAFAITIVAPSSGGAHCFARIG